MKTIIKTKFGDFIPVVSMYVLHFVGDEPFAEVCAIRADEEKKSYQRGYILRYNGSNLCPLGNIEVLLDKDVIEVVKTNVFNETIVVNSDSDNKLYRINFSRNLDWKIEKALRVHKIFRQTDCLYAEEACNSGIDKLPQ